MNSSAEIKQLAEERLIDAQTLLNNGRYEGAFYLAGYAVELTLKAKVCIHLDIDDLFSDNPTSHSKGSLGKFRDSVMTHDLFILLNLCGLGQKFEKKKLSDVYFNQNCSLLFQSPTATIWSEKVRYKQGYITKKNVVKIINFLTEPTKGLLQWIENN
jgi:HEPN domain